MKLYLPAYPRGIHNIEEVVTAESIDLDPDVFSRVEVLIVLDRHDPYLQTVFKLSASVNLECDRCLTEFRSEVRVDKPMLYVLGSVARGEEIDDPDLVVVPANTTELDITQELRDFLLLELPGRSLCKSDCLGICSNCGADLNREPCKCSDAG